MIDLLLVSSFRDRRACLASASPSLCHSFSGSEHGPHHATVYLAEPLPVERGAPEAPAQVLKGCNGLRRKGKKKKMRKKKKKTRPDDSKCFPRALDVIPASAPGELFRVNACNYTGLTARGPSGLRSIAMRLQGRWEGDGGVRGSL